MASICLSVSSSFLYALMFSWFGSIHLALLIEFCLSFFVALLYPGPFAPQARIISLEGPGRNSATGQELLVVSAASWLLKTTEEEGTTASLLLPNRLLWIPQYQQFTTTGWCFCTEKTTKNNTVGCPRWERLALARVHLNTIEDRGSPRGRDTHRVLCLARIKNLVLLPIGSMGSKTPDFFFPVKCVYPITCQVKRTCEINPIYFFYLIWETFHLARQISNPTH